MNLDQLAEYLPTGTTLLILQVGLILAVFWLLAGWKRVFPHGPLIVLAMVPLAGSIALIFFPAAAPLVWIVDGLIMLVALADLFTLPRKRDYAVQRTVGRTASLKKPHRVELTIIAQTSRTRFLEIRDDLPQEFTAEPKEFQFFLAGDSQASLTYELTSSRRGLFRLEWTYLRIRSRLTLWKRYLRYPEVSVIHVYPDMKQMSQFAMLARTNRLSLLGVRRTRRVGTDNEFERLRDYTPDDNYKSIDWRSTARRRKLTVKDFQANQSQRLIFMLDCGRMMTNEASGVSLLDHAMNAMLLLSYVALSRGDSVGLITFSDEIHSFVPAQGGQKHMNRLLHASFDRFPRLVESRYDQAFLYLGAHCRKRSLVVLLSNVIDEVNRMQVEQYLANLVGRHLPLGVLLRDRRLYDYADMPHPYGQDLYRAAAAADILSWRNQMLVDLETKGVLSVDVFPEDLAAPLINRYLEIKARHLL